jgi:cobalt-zinc-cadmium efflux system protein
MKQSHDHPMEESQRLLKTAILLSFSIFVLEFAGGIWSRSLALLSDAWHIFIDIWALVLSLLAILLARRPVDDRRTFGLHRMEVLAATVNGFTVFLIAIGILYAAWQRFQNPVAVHSGRLLGISTIGLVATIGVAALFYRQSHRDLNLRSAFLHLVGDVLNSLAVVIAAVLIRVTGSPYIDPIVSALIAFVVLWGSGRLLRESVNTLLEGVPAGIRVPDVETEILRVPGVLSVHDLHVWSICSHLNSLSGHVLIGTEQMPQQQAVLEGIGRVLKARFGIEHTTIQVESKAWPDLDRREEAAGGSL